MKAPRDDRGVASLSSVTGDTNGAFDLMDTEQDGDDYQTIFILRGATAQHG